MSASSSSTGLRKAPTTATTNMPNPSSSSSPSSSSPSPRRLTHSQSQPSSSSSSSAASPPPPSASASASAAAPSVATSPAAATASPALQPTLPSPHAERHVAEARAAVVASIGNMLDAELQSRAAVLHANAAALERQERDVARATDGLRRDTQRLRAEADKAARRVKELGNVQNWAEVLERGFLVLEETVRLANGGGETDGEGSKGIGNGVRGVENDAVRRLRTMDLNSMSDASRSLMNILEASSSTGRTKGSGTTTISTG
ncbi:hypothetical protein J3F83DRAFT_717815 [Trichoderma novae-zelandiae]